MLLLLLLLSLRRFSFRKFLFRKTFFCSGSSFFGANTSSRGEALSRNGEIEKNGSTLDVEQKYDGGSTKAEVGVQVRVCECMCVCLSVSDHACILCPCA